MSSADIDYQQRGGTLNLGNEYEMLIPALFALRAICRPDIVDMWLASNAEGMGAFDDVIFYVEFENGRKKFYAIQLKHKKDAISATSFKDKSNDYSILKYQKSFEQIMQINEANINSNNNDTSILQNICVEDITLLIYTTSDLAEPIDKTVMKSLNLVLQKEDIDQKEASLLSTNSNNKNFVYKFKTADKNLDGFNETFLSHFFLYVSQGRTSLVEHLIQQLITEKFSNSDVNVKLNFLEFIKRWAHGDLGGHYRLNKNEVQLKITELLLNPYLVQPKTFSQFKKANLWNELVNSVEVTIVQNYKEEMVSKIWTAINSLLYKYADRKIKEDTSWEKLLGLKLPDLPGKYEKQGLKSLTLKQVGTGGEITMKNLCIILWKAGFSPLLLQADDLADAKNICNALALSNRDTTKRHSVLLFKGEDENLQKLFEDFSIIQTLADVKDMLLIQKILENLEVSLQEKEPTQLSRIMEKDSVVKEITTEMLLGMLYRPLIIGKKFEELPKNYINRSVTKILLSKEVLKLQTSAFVVSGSENVLEELKQITDSWRVIDGTNYFKHVKEKEESKPNIIALSENAILAPDSKEIQHFGKSVEGSMHYLRFDSGHLEWLSSLGPIDEIKQYLNNFKRSETSVSEDHMLQHFSKEVNIISSNPGMGKSVILRRLAEKCMTDHWVTFIPLNSHSSYFRECKAPTAHSFSSLESLPYQSFTKALISNLEKKKKVLCLMDAFDEISSKYTEAVISCAKSFKGKGYQVWITTRPVHSSHLEEKLNSFSLALNPISAKDQQTFFKNYLLKKKKENLNTFIEKLQKLISKSFSNWDLGFLGVPLHLHMVAEIFADYNINDFNKIEELNTIDLYETFVNNKLDWYWKKMFSGEENCMIMDMRKMQLEILRDRHAKAALLLFYPKSSLERIFNYEDIKQFLKNIKMGEGNVGIITSVSDLDQPTFAHRTYAEYLAAKFLASSYQDEKFKPLLISLFEEDLTVVRQLFDRMLAKNRPLHLAVLNNNSAEAAELLKNRKGCSDFDFDLGGRTPLHLAAAWGARHTFPKTTRIKPMTNLRLTIVIENDHRINFIDSQALEILKQVFDVQEFSDKVDNIFGWRATHYAVHSSSLDALEVIFVSSYCSEVLQNFDKTSLVYYCVKCGYKNILTSLNLKDEYTKEIETNKNLLHIAVDNDKNSLDILKILIKNSSSLALNHYLQRRDFKGGQPLTYAARKGNLEVFQSLLKYTEGLNKSDSCGLFLLHYLAFYNQSDCLKELLKEDDIDINARVAGYRKRDFTFKNPGHTALHFAVVNGNLEILKLLLQHGADVLLKYENERTVLHVASISGHSDCIQLLLNNGAEINSFDDCRRTPLHYAIQNVKLETVNYLLQLGANINAPDSFGQTPLHYATQNFKLNQIVFPDRLRLDVGKLDNDGRTPLHYASQNIKTIGIKYLLPLGNSIENWHHYGTTPSNRATRDDKLSNIEFLVKYGASPNQGDSRGRTPLHYAVEQGNFETVECLLQFNADINKRDKNGQTPLFQATQNAKFDVVKFILQFSPDINKSDDFKVTPLHLAVAQGSNKLARELIINEANVNLSTVDGCTPLFIAVKKNNDTLVKLLIENDANANKTCLDENFNCIERREGKEILTKNYLSPLQVAARVGNTSIIKSLLESKVKINHSDNNGWTALHFAAKGGHTDCIDELLNRGAAIHLQTKDGSTSIHLAAKNNHHATLKIILKTKCEKFLNLFNGEGQTALHIAAFYGFMDCVKVLVAKGADVNLTTGDGFTALNLAVNQGHEDLQKYFE